MWQIYTLASLLFQAGEEVVDKIVIVSDLAIDTIAATFYRNAVYFLFAVIIGLTGILGHLTLVLSWPIALVGLLSVGSAIFYTYLLKHVELTGSSALGYSQPLIFLFIDLVILKAAFSGAQITGKYSLLWHMQAGGFLPNTIKK